MKNNNERISKAIVDDALLSIEIQCADDIAQPAMPSGEGFRTDKTHQMNAAMRELYEVQAHRQTEIIAGLQADIDRTHAEWCESDRRQKKTITRLHLALFAVGLFTAYMAVRG